jgi:hypothetical protein
LAISNVRITAAQGGYIVGNVEPGDDLRPTEAVYVFTDFSNVLEFLEEKNGKRVKLAAVLDPAKQR